jgi:hypothetical protein
MQPTQDDPLPGETPSADASADHHRQCDVDAAKLPPPGLWRKTGTLTLDKRSAARPRFRQPLRRGRTHVR